MRNKIIFLHMPKSGGTTLQTILERQFPQSESLRVKEKLQHFPKEKINHMKFVSSHLPFDKALASRDDWSYITMLRDPTRRIISQYFASLEDPSDRDYAHIKDLTLAEYAHFPTNKVSNLQTRLLIGQHRGLLRERTQDPLPDNAIETAKEHLSKYFDIVGVTEEFDRMLLVIQSVFDFPNLYYRKNNTTPRKRKRNISHTDIQAIHDANQADIEVYQYARELLHTSIKQSSVYYFEKTLSDFQKKNRYAAPFIALKESILYICKKTPYYIPGFIKQWIRLVSGQK